MKSIFVFASNNAHKLKEIREILPKDIIILSLNDAGIENIDIIEDGKTYKENSLIKARAISKLTNLPVLADDSGLEIKFIGKHKPGIYTKRYSESNGGQAKTNMMLAEKAKNTPKRKNKATFYCTISLVNYKSKTLTFNGKMKGKIAHSPGGDNGFGYDPIFIPKGYDKCVAELSEEIKNSISHRNAALKKFIKYVQKY